MPSSARSRSVLGAVAFTAIFAACTSGGGDGVVDVRLDEFTVTPSATSAPEGSVTFAVENDGVIPHDLVVFASDDDPSDLPVDEVGAVDVEQVDEAGRIAPIAGGDAETLTLDLDAGSYVLVCNVADGSESHYQQGMYARFTVG